MAIAPVSSFCGPERAPTLGSQLPSCHLSWAETLLTWVFPGCTVPCLPCEFPASQAALALRFLFRGYCSCPQLQAATQLFLSKHIYNERKVNTSQVVQA